MFLMPDCLDEGVATPANWVKNELAETFPGSAIVNISVSYASPHTRLQRFSRTHGRNKYLVNQTSSHSHFYRHTVFASQLASAASYLETAALQTIFLM